MRKITAGGLVAALVLFGVIVWGFSAGHPKASIAAGFLAGCLIAFFFACVYAQDPDGLGRLRSGGLMLLAIVLFFAGVGTAFAADGASTAGVREIALRYAVFYGTGVAGMLANYVVKWSREEVREGLVSYFVRSSPRRTIATLVGLAVSEATAFTSGVLDPLSVQALLGAGFMCGYTLDSAINKGRTL